MLELWLPKRPAEEAMQKSIHRDAKKQPSGCKDTKIGMSFDTKTGLFCYSKMLKIGAVI